MINITDRPLVLLEGLALHHAIQEAIATAINVPEIGLVKNVAQLP